MQIPVDLTGIADGDTLIYQNGTLVTGPLSAPPIVGADLDALGTPNYDGADGVIEDGSDTNKWREEFSWDLTRGKWRGTTIYQLIRTLDGWAVDWTHQPLAMVRNAWCRPNGGVGWARSGGAAKVRTDIAVPADSTPFATDVYDEGLDELPDTGQLATRGLTFTYTGIDRTPGTAQITGMVRTSGTGGVTLPADYTPLIPYAPVLGGGGDPGGWGFVPRAITNAGALWDKGFRPLVQISGLMCGSMDEKVLELGVFFQQYDYNDDSLYTQLTAAPLVGMLGPAITLQGPSDPHAGIGGGGGDILSERSFEWGSPSTSGWQAWAAGTISKEIIIPAVYGRMPADADDTGQAYRVTVELVWEGTP